MRETILIDYSNCFPHLSYSTGLMKTIKQEVFEDCHQLTLPSSFLLQP